MATKTIIKNDYQRTQPKVGDLMYGTFVTEIPSNPSSVYIKVDKKEHNQGVAVCVPNGSSALLNVKTGQIRQVPGNTYCRVLEAEISLMIVPSNQLCDFVKK